MGWLGAGMGRGQAMRACKGPGRYRAGREVGEKKPALGGLWVSESCGALADGTYLGTASRV